jgi:hypothetical protein
MTAPPPAERAGEGAMLLRDELAAALWRAMQDGYERACDDRPIMIDLAFARANDRLALITTAALAELRSAPQPVDRAGGGEAREETGRWFLLRVRETSAPEVLSGSEQEIRELYDLAATQWSDTFILREVVGPNVAGSVNANGQRLASLRSAVSTEESVTAPTDAMVEAAARAIWNGDQDDSAESVPAKWHGHYTDLARRALTAAARAGEGAKHPQEKTT